MSLRSLILVLCVLGLPSSAAAQSVTGYAEFQNLFEAAGPAAPQVNTYFRGPLHGKFGWTTWTLATETWSEALGGLTFAPVKWLEFSATVGIETHDRPVRGSVSAWLGRGRISSLTILEDGGSGVWYKHYSTVRTTSRLSLGVLSQRFAGHGPYLEYKAGRVRLWGAFLGDSRGTRGMGGVQLHLQ